MEDLTIRSFKLPSFTNLDSQLAYINPNFERAVVSHIIGNYMKNSPYPLYLAIHGPKGEGKTFQTIRTCSKYNIAVYYISGAELCGSYEKDSITAIEKNLDDAIEEYKKSNIVSVFVIDDFHLSIASISAGVSRTVNSQILTGWLMNLADRAKSSTQPRIPFILLGNDFSNLYDPLTRDGRMDFFEWRPDESTKKKIICRHFEDYVPRDNREFSRLIDANINQPISFFAEIKNDMFKEIISEQIVSSHEYDALRLIQNVDSSHPDTVLKKRRDLVAMIEEQINSRLISLEAKETIHEKRKGAVL